MTTTLTGAALADTLIDKESSTMTRRKSITACRTGCWVRDADVFGITTSFSEPGVEAPELSPLSHIAKTIESFLKIKILVMFFFFASRCIPHTAGQADET